MCNDPEHRHRELEGWPAPHYRGPRDKGDPLIATDKIYLNTKNFGARMMRFPQDILVDTKGLRMNLDADNAIQIVPVTNGWIVKSGCFNLVFTDANLLTVEVGRWLADPTSVRAEYLKKYSYRNQDRSGGFAQEVTDQVAPESSAMASGKLRGTPEPYPPGDIRRR